MGWTAWRRRRLADKTTKSASRRARPLRSLFGRQYLVEEPYFLAKDDQEINRLDFQHFLFRFALKGNYAAPVTAPANILDVGTGTGRWAMELAALFPQANVIGLDVVPPPADDTPSLGYGLERRPDNYVYVQGNVLEGLPFPDATFDFVHQRLLVAAIPEARWPSVVAELLRVTKPGGWVELLEAIPAYGGPAMNLLHDWLVGVGLPRGVNIMATPQIGAFLRAAGAQNVVERELPMALGKWGGRAGSMMETNYYALHEGILARLLADQTTTAESFEATMQAARREIAQGRYVWPYFIAYGQRPGQPA
ncbi:MAG TPA: class I SAM-dependent methyltransferase [Ktedonobacterales bacterium]